MKKMIISSLILSMLAMPSMAASLYAPYVPAYTASNGAVVSVKSDLDVINYKDVEIILQTKIDDPSKPYITRKTNHFYYVLDPRGSGIPYAVLYRVDRYTHMARNSTTVLDGSVTPTMIVPLVEGSDEYKLSTYAFKFAVESGKMAKAKAKSK
mgnify:CR=1 FL=1